MRIVFTGGGTAGHILPNVAIIRNLGSKEIRNLGILYIGEKGGIEEKMMEDERIRFFGIHVGKMRRYFSLKNFFDGFKIVAGFFESLLILRRLKPNLVFSKGGYVSMPVALAARVLKIPVWHHESDVSPGLSTKIISRFAQKIFLSFEESRAFFPNKDVDVIGNPIRSSITEGSAEEGRRLAGFSTSKPIILVMGGSLGARALNEIVLKSFEKLLKRYNVIHIAGSNFTAPSHAGYRAFSFVDIELPHFYACADLVLCRAGSGTIFELLACGKRMLLVPLPRFASRGDQIENAAVFEKNGWASVLQQEQCSVENFLGAVAATLRKSAPHALAKNTAAAALLVQEIILVK